jgi:MFS family permease
VGSEGSYYHRLRSHDRGGLPWCILQGLSEYDHLYLDSFQYLLTIGVVYVVGRLLLGFGNSLAQMASPVLLIELCHPQHRGKVTTIYNCLWNLGALGRSNPEINLALLMLRQLLRGWPGALCISRTTGRGEA